MLSHHIRNNGFPLLLLLVVGGADFVELKTCAIKVNILYVR